MAVELHDHIHLYQVGQSKVSYYIQGEPFADTGSAVFADRTLTGEIKIYYINNSGAPAKFDDRTLYIVGMTADELSTLRSLCGKECHFAPVNHDDVSEDTYQHVYPISVNSIQCQNPTENTWWTAQVTIMAKDIS